MCLYEDEEFPTFDLLTAILVTVCILKFSQFDSLLKPRARSSEQGCIRLFADVNITIIV